MEEYQAIYDAVRSRLSNCDVGSAVENAMNLAGIGHSFSMCTERIAQSFSEHERPSVLFRPQISLDGNKWLALYGSNIQDGLAGFGDSPDEAMRNFDKAWYENIGVISK